MKYLSLEKLEVTEENFNYKGKDGKIPSRVTDVITLERFEELYCYDSNSSLEYHKKKLEKNLFTAETIGSWLYMKATVHIPDKLGIIKKYLKERNFELSELKWLVNWIHDKIEHEKLEPIDIKLDLNSIFVGLEKLPNYWLFYLIDEYLHIR